MNDVTLFFIKLLAIRKWHTQVCLFLHLSSLRFVKRWADCQCRCLRTKLGRGYCFFTYTFLHVYFEVVSEEVWLLWNDSLNSSREMSLKRGAWFLNFKILSTGKDKRVAESWSTTIGDELMVVSSILINECYKCRKKFQIIANNIFQNIKYFESFSSPHLFSLWDESVNYYAF